MRIIYAHRSGKSYLQIFSRYSPDILSELYHNTEDMSMPFFKIPRKRIKYPKLFMRFISDNTEFCKAVDNISYRPIILMTPV